MIRYWMALIFAGTLIISCGNEGPTGPYWTSYHIYVDSIRVQDEVQQTEMLDIYFYFLLPSSCHIFDSFETSFDANTLTVKLIGKEQHKVPCDGMIYYKEKILPIIGFPTGMCYIEILQPVGTNLVDSVNVWR